MSIEFRFNRSMEKSAANMNKTKVISSLSLSPDTLRGETVVVPVRAAESVMRQPAHCSGSARTLSSPRSTRSQVNGQQTVWVRSLTRAGCSSFGRTSAMKLAWPTWRRLHMGSLARWTWCSTMPPSPPWGLSRICRSRLGMPAIGESVRASSDLLCLLIHGSLTP
jgi:hypothetical protein